MSIQLCNRIIHWNSRTNSIIQLNYLVKLMEELLSSHCSGTEPTEPASVHVHQSLPKYFVHSVWILYKKDRFFDFFFYLCPVVNFLIVPQPILLTFRCTARISNDKEIIKSIFSDLGQDQSIQGKSIDNMYDGGRQLFKRNPFERYITVINIELNQLG